MYGTPTGTRWNNWNIATQKKVVRGKTTLSKPLAQCIKPMKRFINDINTNNVRANTFWVLPPHPNAKQLR